MFFADKPYVSDFFKKTVRDNNIPVVGTEEVKDLDLFPGTGIIDENRAAELAEDCENLRAYALSENSIGWIAKHLGHTDLPRKIDLFKDKLKFREITRDIFPDFYFRGAGIEELDSIRPTDIPFPVIVKPAVGFFSMGVYRVSNRDEWTSTLKKIHAEINKVQNIYPREVMDAERFIIEQSIDGDEFAVDAYFDSAGEPVLLSVFKHTFSSDADVSDRVYTTSTKIIENNLEEFTRFARKIGRATGIRNFPVHMELRRGKNKQILPIEINPLRFGGWCTTADMTHHAWGFNPYLYYYQDKKPDWSELFKKKHDKLFSIIVLDNSTGIDGANISSFDYDRLLSKFENPLELRKTDYKTYPVFGFLFTETGKENRRELEYILNSDLKEFVQTDDGRQGLK